MYVSALFGKKSIESMKCEKKSGEAPVFLLEPPHPASPPYITQQLLTH